ncbi:hypothetical protein SFRURICE_004247 [Spodoptera frugiperda]|uniref:SFRICE_015875 n=1 Tax=Spodoptera frugiperda TaxID=7108 RepID=A0A2H1WCI4_SPOFR|nr:hypothetical protein SFRURICE_004247 [Spodoptera frugiperda]
MTELNNQSDGLLCETVPLLQRKCYVDCFGVPQGDVTVSVRVLFHQICATLRCCRCVWIPPIIFIRTHSLTLVETHSARLCFLYGKMRAWDGFPTIDLSHTRAVHLPRTAVRRIGGRFDGAVTQHAPRAASRAAAAHHHSRNI